MPGRDWLAVFCAGRKPPGTQRMLERRLIKPRKTAACLNLAILHLAVGANQHLQDDRAFLAKPPGGRPWQPVGAAASGSS